MKFFRGILKPYESLRNVSPSIYYLEEFCYKVLPVEVRADRNIFIDEENVTSEPVVTLNFPEFLDVAVNLDLVKSVHSAFDVFFQQVGEVTGESKINSLIKLDTNNSIGTRTQYIAPFPEGMIRLFFGYRHMVVRDPNKLLQHTEALCCRKLSEMEDDCFIWTEVIGTELKITTGKPTVCKYKMELDLQLLVKWLEDSTAVTLDRAIPMLNGKDDKLGVNFVCHPPYQGRMSFKDNIKILYPYKTVKFKTLDKVSFRTNKSYVLNNKLYEIVFIDKDTDEVLFQYNSAVHTNLFSAVLKQVDTTKVNSYMDEEVRTFDDSILVDFSIPSAIQPYLAQHRNYKIRVICRDLTTQNN